MLDLKQAIKDPAALARNCQHRGIPIDIDRIVQAHRALQQLSMPLQEEKERQNAIASRMKGQQISPEDRAQFIQEGRECKVRIAQLSESVQQREEELRTLCLPLPNWTHAKTPLGGEKDGKILRLWGSPRKFAFTPKDHLELGNCCDLLDFEAGASLAGSKFVFLRNQAVYLELALVRFALDFLQNRGFTPVAPPDIARREIVEGLGFQPRGNESQIYSLTGTDLCLAATAEIALGGALHNRLLSHSELPLKFAGVSHCFRTEAGTHGRDSKGLYRLHQFTKVEMFAATMPESSEAFHETLLEFQEEIMRQLELPYRVVEIAAGDLGGPAYRKFDIEAWMPSREDFGEVTSASNCTDFQARRLKIRYKDAFGKNQLVHTLNGTAIAISRILLALLENNQRSDGSIQIPHALVAYCGFNEIAAK